RAGTGRSGGWRPTARPSGRWGAWCGRCSCSSSCSCSSRCSAAAPSGRPSGRPSAPPPEPMERVHAVAAMQARADAARAAGRRLALVPTMGALHEGHLALVEEAKRRADHVTVSVFVNPTQFAPGEDYARYPRTLDADVAALEAAGGVDVVFAPDA